MSVFLRTACLCFSAIFFCLKSEAQTAVVAEIKSVTDVKELGEGDAVMATLRLSHALPNQNVKIIISGKGSVLTAMPLRETAVRAPVKDVQIQWSPSKEKFKPESLKGKLVHLVSFALKRKVTGYKFLDDTNSELHFDDIVPNGDATMVFKNQDGEKVVKTLSLKNQNLGDAVKAVTIQGFSQKEREALKGQEVTIITQ